MQNFFVKSQIPLGVALLTIMLLFWFCGCYFIRLIICPLLFCMLTFYNNPNYTPEWRGLKFNSWLGFFVVYLCCVGVCSKVDAFVNTKFPEAPYYTSDNSIECELENNFKNFKVCSYELNELGNRPYDIEKRLPYIRAEVVTINKTDCQSKKRTRDLKKRRYKYCNNILKVNKRCNKANINPLIVFPPEINNENVDLEPAFKRIKLWSIEIGHNIENPNCNPVKAFNNIDYASYNIVKEIDSIKHLQDLRNAYLTRLEKNYDYLEKIEREKENQLTVIGY